MSGPRISKITSAELWGEQFTEQAILNPAWGLTEAGMRGRVIMLKRMRRILICEWTPIIDILLGDYERILAHVESLREKPEDVDPDVQDRDFDQE